MFNLISFLILCIYILYIVTTFEQIFNLDTWCIDVSKQQIIILFADTESADLQDCYLKKDSSGLAWDAICFIFLLIQIRILRSHYFRHVVTDLVACNTLAARYAASHLWNDLPCNMRTCDSLYQFKRLLKTYLFKKKLFTREHWRTFVVFRIYLFIYYSELLLVLLHSHYVLLLL